MSFRTWKRENGYDLDYLRGMQEKVIEEAYNAGFREGYKAAEEQREKEMTSTLIVEGIGERH